ncbi:mediator of RNA polymerase II transcription subunit 12 [Phalaenopsis equestris]|uniref:mediator of RNA polymerase II transcription subunit 12 n=1 Tax=Phalaenopsis equestris TaxID=78828 RepID=UPI0009E1D6A7|nr:mediator of RNA polymerase II transcription subunit 12 [Phalaenopsis equestris]XP_020598944.1 mediator of RNA polymerase II transcription subunit 12 [Phalaenopsis equestris]XP_020598945.1 mediator of RNA polymerase II transcription subunit 12 [Phalaenopsis equestris]XP_020598946.1 mediator of RNA polymerase II transcription subunit 12 [Phalaenopsis equestris]
MQRYTATSGGAGVSISSVGGVSSRENTRVDPSFLSSNFSQNSRRPQPLHPYKLKIDREPLNFRLGPPDLYPQTPNCPEETLTKEYLQSGYKETVEGIEEAREIVLTTASYFTKPELILKCKEAIRRRLRAINESRAQKRKAGQVYGVPLTGHLLIKSGSFPEQRSSSEDFRKKWIEALSSHGKRLRSLADYVPHGYRRKSLFEVLIRHNVPLLRATWFIKVTYLNQIRPASSISSGTQDKAHFNRTELWTKDVVEYMQQLLDEYLTKDGSGAPVSSRDQSSTGVLSRSAPKIDSGGTTSDVEEPSSLYKWWYMVHLLRWSYSEGLILPSVVVEWVLNQLQEKDSTDVFEMLLPIVYEVIEIIALSQTYTRGLVDIAVRSINDLSVGGSTIIETSKKSSLSYAVVEIIRYLILAVPDTFVALDCFPLPPCVVPDIFSARKAFKVTKGIDCIQIGKQDDHLRYLSFGYAASSIQKRASNLANTANPGLQGQGAAKIVQLLDKAYNLGDTRLAYNAVFEDFFDLAVEEKWMVEVSPSLRSSLKWIGNVDLSFICSVFFICEWATCGYRDYRTTAPENHKVTGVKNFSKVYTAVFLLKLKMEQVCFSPQSRNANLSGSTGKAVSCPENLSCMASLENSIPKNKNTNHGKNCVDIFESPGPLHDIIVCWLDQHEIGRGGGFKHLQVLILELIRNGIFYPPAYVRHLIVSGIMDRNETSFDLERRKRHYRILKQLPGACLFEALEESEVLEAEFLNAAVQVYSNERQLVLHGSFGHSSHLPNKHDSYGPFSLQRQKDLAFASKEGSSMMLLETNRNSNIAFQSRPFVNAKVKDQVAELKVLISTLLRFPYTCSAQIETQVDESPGSQKRLLGSSGIRFDSSEGIVSCEDCREAKRQKLTEERSSSHQIIASNQSDDEDTWWVRKGPKSVESMKVESANKLTKHVSRGRQKTVRKMSLSQLAAARIESSEGASTSHVCDNKMSCPHHRSGVDGKVSKEAFRLKSINLSDIGKTIKQLRLLEKRSISIWLSTSIKQLVDGSEKTVSKPSNGNGSFSTPLEERNTVRWKLGEEELSTILYILDISSDLILAVKLLLWLLTKTFCGQNNNGHVGRNVVMLTKGRENHVCQVGEAFFISALQRYENVIVATDLLPELLNAAMHRTMATLTPSGRSFCPAFAYIRNLLKKYRDVSSVIRWEKNFKSTCDQRFLTELDTGRMLDGDIGFSAGVSGGISDFDDYIRQKITVRVSRTGSSMKEIVQRHVEEAMHYFYGKERKPFTTANANFKNSTEKWDDACQVAQEIVTGLNDCIRQNGGAALEGDPSIVASAVSSIVGNLGPSVVKVPDFINCSHQNLSSSSTSLNCARYILYIHIISLCLLKEALGERLGRVFEIALAVEASVAISGSLSSVKTHRNPYQQSPEAHDISPNHSNEILNNSANVVGLKVAKATAAISALVLGAIVHGAVNLERMVTAFKLKEGLNVLQFIRSAKSSSNGGISRSFGNFKLEPSVEVLAHWFRLLVGNTEAICDGLVLEILGESYIIALSRMQRMLPLNLVLIPVYSIFAMVIWRPYVLNSSIATREDIHLYHLLSLTVTEVIRHQPFRDLCFQNTHAFYDLLANDVGDSEFAAMLELLNPDKQLKTRAFVPLRARLFLNALIDCKMPLNTLIQEDGSLISESVEPMTFSEMEQNLLSQLVHVLDTLQPAKFHWQWVELRLLLNEKALLEKIDMKDMSLVETIRSVSPNADNFAVSESDKFLSEIILTRILVRPDAAPLYAEIVHLLGRSLEESLVMGIKWILAGSDVLSGRKSIRQQLVSVAQRKCLSIKTLFWKPWGWPNLMADIASNRGEKNKLDMVTIEEGEVVDDASDAKRSGKINFPTVDADNITSSQQYVIEKAIAELILPCLDRSSADLCNSFAVELIKQMNMIDQQINVFTRGGSKQPGLGPSGVELSSNKGSSRKGLRGGSPGLGRRAITAADSPPPSATSLKASIWLRMQFLVRLLPIVLADRNLRQMLASIILHLVGTRFVHEDADLSLSMVHMAPPKREMEVEVSAAALLDYSGDSLFDTFLCVLHGLLSSCKPSWLKPKSVSKSLVKSPRDFSAFDSEAMEAMQADLDHMELPTTIRRRLQAAMPILPVSLSLYPPYHPPLMPTTAPSLSPPLSSTLAPLHRSTPSRPLIKNKSLSSQDLDNEIDPWTLLEDGTGCSVASVGGSGGSVSGDHSNLKACSWLKGAVRIRRTDLTYVGVLDDES